MDEVPCCFLENHFLGLGHKEGKAMPLPHTMGFYHEFASLFFIMKICFFLFIMKFAGVKPERSISEIVEGEYIEEVCIRICEEKEIEQLTYLLQSECGLDRLRVIKRSEDINDENCVHSIFEALNRSKKCNLCSISLDGFEIEGHGLDVFSQDCSLQFLELIECSINNVNWIVDGISRGRLRGLRLKKSYIRGVLKLSMAIAYGSTKLQSFYIDDYDLDLELDDDRREELWEAFACGMMRGNCGLQELHLRGSRLDNGSISSIAKALTSGFCDLQTLDLLYYYGSPQLYTPIIEALKTKNCRLQTLKISLPMPYSSADADADALAEALCSGLCKLETLDLSDSQVDGNAVLISLGKALKSNRCRLKNLYMKYMKGLNIKDEGVHALANALENGQCSLQILDLTNNFISGKGIKQLKNAITSGKCRMKSLWLGIYDDDDDEYDYHVYADKNLVLNLIDAEEGDVLNLIHKIDGVDSEDIEDREIPASTSKAGDNIAEIEEECPFKGLPKEGKMPKQITKEDVPYEEFTSVWKADSLPGKNMDNLPNKMNLENVRPQFKIRLQELAHEIYPKNRMIYEVRKQFYLAFAYENCNKARANPSKYKVNWAAFACQALKYSSQRKGKRICETGIQYESSTNKKRRYGSN